MREVWEATALRVAPEVPIRSGVSGILIVLFGGQRGFRWAARCEAAATGSSPSPPTFAAPSTPGPAPTPQAVDQLDRLAKTVSQLGPVHLRVRVAPATHELNRVGQLGMPLENALLWCHATDRRRHDSVKLPLVAKGQP